MCEEGWGGSDCGVEMEGLVGGWWGEGGWGGMGGNIISLRLLRVLLGL